MEPSTMESRRAQACAIYSIALLLLFFLTLPPSAQARQRSSASSPLDSEFQAAMTARDRGDLDHAKSLLLDLRRRRPGNFAIDESLGLVYVAQGRYADALPFLEAAVREQPSSDAAHANLGADYFKLERNKDALDEYKVAVRLNPNNPATQRGLGEVLLNAGRPQQAVAAFSAALTANANDPDLQLSLATALVGARDFDRAQKVLASLPGTDSDADVEVLLAQCAEGKGDPLAAAHHFQRAVELDPTEEHVWALGVEYLRHWTFAAAIPEFEAATQKFPTSTRMKVALGASYFGDAKYRQAIPVFASLLDNGRDSALYAELLGMACNAVTESDKQQCASLIAYARTHPRDAKASTYAASMLLTETASDNRAEEARLLLKNALAAAPEFANAQYQMAVLKQEDGDWSGSISNLETAVKLKPDLAQAHYRLALAYARTGRKDEAQTQIALQKQYAQQEQQDLDRRLRQITTFLVDVKRE